MVMSQSNTVISQQDTYDYITVFGFIAGSALWQVAHAMKEYEML